MQNAKFKVMVEKSANNSFLHYIFTKDAML